MELTMEQPVEESRYLLEEYYKLNVEPFLSVLSKDCCWILPSNHMVVGDEAARRMFRDGFVMPPFRMEDVRAEALETGNPEQKTVYLDFTVSSDPASEMVLSERQRATLCYRKEAAGWRLYHLHVSMAWTQPPEGEVFPVELSRQTYQYLQKLLEESRREGTKQRVILKDESSTNVVDPDLVRYVEAADKASILHTLDQTLLVRVPLKELERSFPKHFVRVHRSHLVNSRYVLRIERFSLTLATGERLPIPEKRYTQLRGILLEHLEAPGRRTGAAEE